MMYEVSLQFANKVYDDLGSKEYHTIVGYIARMYGVSVEKVSDDADTVYAGD